MKRIKLTTNDVRKIKKIIDAHFYGIRIPRKRKKWIKSSMRRRNVIMSMDEAPSDFYGFVEQWDNNYYTQNSNT